MQFIYISSLLERQAFLGHAGQTILTLKEIEKENI